MIGNRSWEDRWTGKEFGAWSIESCGVLWEEFAAADVGFLGVCSSNSCVSIMQNNTNFLYTSSMPYNLFTLPLLTQNVQHQNFRSLLNALLPRLSDTT